MALLNLPLTWQLSALDWMILKWSFSCRAISLLVQMVLNMLVVDYDSSACCLSTNSQVTEFLFGGVNRWDSVYFLKIASDGYNYEQYAAFFPMWPATIHLIASTVLAPLSSVLPAGSCLVLSAVLAGTLFFCGAAVILCRLTLAVTHDRRLSVCASLLFCINPAMAFFNAAYTTSMFTFISFSVMLLWQQGHVWISTSLMMLACGVRSNGMLCAGFIAYGFLQVILKWLVQKSQRPRKFLFIVYEFASPSLQVALVALALMGFQYKISTEFCDHVPYHWTAVDSISGRNMTRQLSTAHLPWCNSSLRMSYGHIQSEYWNVGFLRYFEFKQIPNFALASPVIILTLIFAVMYGRRMWPYLCHLQFFSSGSGLWSMDVFPYAVHWVAFVTLCVLNIHIQVLTRLVASASPVLYWFAAELFLMDGPSVVEPSPTTQTLQGDLVGKADRRVDSKKTTGSNWLSNLVLLYFVGYGYLGLALHTNFYPWT